MLSAADPRPKLASSLGQRTTVAAQSFEAPLPELSGFGGTESVRHALLGRSVAGKAVWPDMPAPVRGGVALSRETWLAGRTALVTGGASGLGRATSLALGEAGAHIVVADMDGPGADSVAAEIRAKGAAADPAELDVTDDSRRRAVMQENFDKHGESFDILINVAGIDLPGYANDISLADFERVMAVNCTGPTFLISEFMKVVKDRPAGTLSEVVNIISLSAITVGSGAAAYNGSKAAFAKVTECFQREILEFGWPCRMQGIMPAAMDTPMMERWGIAPERMMPPSDVAAEVLHCLRRPPTNYGQNLVVVPRREPDFPR